MSELDEFGECKNLKELSDAIISLREAIDTRLGPVLEVFTFNDAAAYLQVSGRQVQILSVEKGLIAYSQLNGDRSAVRFKKGDLDDYLLRCRVPTNEEARANIR